MRQWWKYIFCDTTKNYRKVRNKADSCRNTKKHRKVKYKIGSCRNTTTINLKLEIKLQKYNKGNRKAGNKVGSCRNTTKKAEKLEIKLAVTEIKVHGAGGSAVAARWVAATIE